MAESAEVRELRRDLGRRLATARKEGGYSQREFAHRISFARSTLSTVESGIQRAGRGFWEACDRVLGTGDQFQLGYDRIRQRLATERQNTPVLRPQPGRQPAGLAAATLAEALPAYRALGWPVLTDNDRAYLKTGTVLDALAVPRPAGLLAACWWLGTGGTADLIRNLPALPDPAQALAVITCGSQSYFLAAAGPFPFAGLPRLGHKVEGPGIVWHSDGSRIPAPPASGPDGEQASWAYLPPGRIQLATPVLLLDLLAKAVAATWPEPHTLTLTGGVQVVPLGGSGPEPTAGLTEPS
jgi:transcriptional regulator with XRE-family HTH domain